MTERWAWEREWLKRLGKRETKRRLDKIWDIVHDPGIPNDDQRGLLWQSLEHYRIESDYRTTKEVKQEFVYYLALYCCDVSALFRFFKSRTPHFGHSVDECTRSMDLSVSIRSALHSEQKYCTSAWPWELKIAAVVVGIFFAVLAYLQYIVIAKIDWPRTENMTREAAQHTLTQVTQVVNNTATTMATHPTVLAAQGLTKAAIAGFFPGLALELKKG